MTPPVRVGLVTFEVLSAPGGSAGAPAPGFGNEKLAVSDPDPTLVGDVTVTWHVPNGNWKLLSSFVTHVVELVAGMTTPLTVTMPDPVGVPDHARFTVAPLTRSSTAPSSSESVRSVTSKVCGSPRR